MNCELTGIGSEGRVALKLPGMGAVWIHPVIYFLLLQGSTLKQAQTEMKEFEDKIGAMESMERKALFEGSRLSKEIK